MDKMIKRIEPVFFTDRQVKYEINFYTDDGYIEDRDNERRKNDCI